MRKEIKIGLFAVLVLAVALFMVEFLKGKDIFSRSNTYYIVYPDVDGLSVSTGITVGGYAAGIISDIRYNRSTTGYTVTASVSRQFDIPSDSYMEVYSSDILGSKKIRVRMGTSAVMAVSGDTLRGCRETDMLSSLTGSIDTLIGNVDMAVKSINLLLDEENRNEVSMLIKRLNSIAENLNAVTGTIRAKSPDIEDLLTNLSSVSAGLDSTVSYINGTAVNAEAISASLKDADLGGLADSVRCMIGKLQDPNGTIGKLMVSDSLYNSLTSLSNNIDSLVSNIRKDPKKYIKISVF